MMKLGYASLFAIIATLIMVGMSDMERNPEPKVKQVRRQLHLLFYMNVVYGASFFTNNVRLLEYAHCVILILEAIAVYQFLQFACVTMERVKAIIRPITSVVRVLVAIDVVLLVINVFSGVFYPFDIKKLHRDEVSVVPQLAGIYWYHILLCVLMVCVLVMFMTYKYTTVSERYKMRYMVIAVIFSIGLMLSLVLRWYTDFSEMPVVLFVTLGGTVMFCVYYFFPRLRIRKMKNFVIGNVNMPVMMFDYDDELQVFNQPAVDELRVEKGMRLEDYIANNNLKYIITSERRLAGKTKEFSLTLTQEDRTYLIHGQELWEKEKKFIGTLLVYTDISKQEKLKDEATYHATRDSLTGLWNREFFIEMVTKTIRENPSIEFVLIVADIHRFRMFNDILGKKTGDDLLLTVAEGFRERKMPLWAMSRISGGRFVLFMPADDYEETGFLNVCQRLVAQRDYALTVHFYFGVYHVREEQIGVADMCDRAGMALESIKGNMRKNIAYYDEEIRKKHLRDTLNEDELTRAMQEGQFVIYLQPQIDTINNRLIGGEALARWISPKRGMIPPSEFIPAFEENCMIAQLDYYLWEAACKQLRAWKDRGKEDLSISVNISAKDFYLTDIYESLTGLVEKYEINPKHLKLEITETALVLNVNEQMALVKRLQEYGFIVEIDDFGSGYSSLNSLKNIMVDVLKLDLKFFEKTADSKRAEVIIESVVQLAYKLNMPVIAEGVEELEQVEMLQRIGCHIVQGFYYAKPMPVDEYERFAERYPSESIEDIIVKIKEGNK